MNEKCRQRTTNRIVKTVPRPASDLTYILYDVFSTPHLQTHKSKVDDRKSTLRHRSVRSHLELGWTKTATLELCAIRWSFVWAPGLLQSSRHVSYCFHWMRSPSPPKKAWPWGWPGRKHSLPTIFNKFVSKSR